MDAEKNPLDRVPQHIAIIMDGNGRWAQSKGLPRLAGHRAGTENLKTILEACVEFGVKYLTIYAFSTENWERPESEVKGLMRIFRTMFDRELKNLHENGVQLRHLGKLDRIDAALRKQVIDAIELTKNNQRLILNVAFNYGGRAEIIHSIQQIIRNEVEPEEVDENLVDQHLYTAGSPDPDLVIRTSGELRTSNFLIWQAAYAEWYFTPTYWPDFGKEELKKALLDYRERERRFGRVSSEDA
ncbi:MAG: Isoprenyl transferase [Chloroflexi bacterium]|nr:Isoprenyl transferase [Chloroflexota bacterium]